MMTRKTMIISLIGILVLLSISGCSGRSSKTPTQDNNAIILTAVANVTQDFFQTIIAFQNATPTPQPSQTLTATPTTIPTIARSPLPGETPTPSTGCNRIVAGVPFDITIPDDTSMQPGQSFTKPGGLSTMHVQVDSIICCSLLFRELYGCTPIELFEC